jgi:hypothetical protein
MIKFGREKEFTLQDAADFCFPLSSDASPQATEHWYSDRGRRDRRIKWARTVRTDARKNASTEMRGFYLACPYGDQNRMIFTKQPDLLRRQFVKDRGNHRGQKDTLIELLRCVELIGGFDEDHIDIPGWMKLYALEREMEDKALRLEDAKREWEDQKRAA